MAFFDKLIRSLPEVEGPQQKHVPFKEKIKWTAIVLVLFFILGLIPLYGLGNNALENFEFLSMILGASFGSIISLGIGPIVTASIILQLLNGAGLVNFDLTTQEGKARFQGTQKILSYFFIVLEAAIYVLLGGLSPQVGISPVILIFQLVLGGFLIMMMDDLINKWGFGSGISLFIAAGVSQSIFIRAFSPLHPINNGVLESAYIGQLPDLFRNLAIGNPTGAGLNFAVLAATVLVFLVVVFAQAMKVEIPLSMGRIRGHGIRWPLSFIYTSVIPVILVSALSANIQLLARLLSNKGINILGTFSGNSPISGLALWISSPNLVEKIVKGTVTLPEFGQSLIYILFMVAGAVLFSWFWMQTSGLDPRSQAKQMMSSGLTIPGFRKDIRVLERLLERYIYPLTIMGGIAIGLLASLADISGALGQGTGILLTVMIIYKLYEEIAQQHMYDMNPMMRKFMGK